MKKLFIIFTLVAINFVAMAQTNQLVWTNGKLMYGTPIATIDSITYGEVQETDTLLLLLPRTLIKTIYDTIYLRETVYVHDTIYINNCVSTPNLNITHEYVDLGLSVKWATCNVGAYKPEDYGNYFAWGEVTPKKSYEWNNYKYCDLEYFQIRNDTIVTKYCIGDTNDSFYDNKTTLDPEDDAATVNWGGNWRMPTYAEMEELKTKCTWEFTTLNGVEGFKVTSTIDGYTNNSIFLPATYMMMGNTLYQGAGVAGCYWSSSLYSGMANYFAHGIFARNKAKIEDWRPGHTRKYGLTIRPVCP